MAKTTWYNSIFCPVHLKKKTGIGLMTNMVYIASMAGIDFLDRNTIESKILSL